MGAVWAGRLLGYAIGLLIGGVACAVLLPADTIAGVGGLWRFPANDLAQNLTGHLAAQADGWRWPPLFAPSLAWPHGLSAALTDSNPLATLIAKAVARRPTNLMGVWLLACWMLQPVAGVFVVRSFRASGPGPGARGWEAAAAAAILAVSFPALLARVAHINLLGHFLLLFALGLSIRLCDRQSVRRWVAAGLVLCLAIASHPYLFIFAVALLAAAPIEAMLERRAVWRGVGAFVAAVTVPVLVFKAISGSLGSGSRGYGYYSMNLLSPVWPQHSGLFGAGLPLLDATGGQYEGFGYLGAGGLLLVGAALVVRRLAWPRPRGLVVVLAGLTLLALSPRVYAGPVLLVPLPLRPWDQLFNLIPSAGRAFWPVGYAVLLGSVATLAARVRRSVLIPLLLLVLGLQLADTVPFVRDARAYLAGTGQVPPPVQLPLDATLASVVPACDQNPAADLLRLQALRGGARLGNVRASRMPPWFNCETDRTDALETPLRPGELRLFLPGLLPDDLVPLGPGAECRSQGSYTLCANGLALAGTALAGGAPPPRIPLATTLDGAGMRPVLSGYWHVDAEGTAWSEGPRATLLFRTATPPRTLRLRLAGIARTPGGTRPVVITVGDGPAVTVDLADGVETDVAVPVAGMGPDGVVRVALDIARPVDPAARGMEAPVRRAGVRLRSVRAEP